MICAPPNNLKKKNIRKSNWVLYISILIHQGNQRREPIQNFVEESKRKVVCIISLFRIELQQQRSSGNLVLYHFVGHSSSRSACPIVMIRRITEKVRTVYLLAMLRRSRPMRTGRILYCKYNVVDTTFDPFINSFIISYFLLCCISM